MKILNTWKFPALILIGGFGLIFILVQIEYRRRMAAKYVLTTNNKSYNVYFLSNHRNSLSCREIETGRKIIVVGPANLIEIK